MSNRVLFWTFLIVGVLSVRAAGQAGAESALTNAGSATSVSGAGSRLGHTLDQTTRRLSDRVQSNVGQTSQNQTQSKPSNTARPMSASTAAGDDSSTTVHPPTGGPMVMTIDGATVPCNSSTRAQGAQAGQSKSGSDASSAHCRSDSTPAPRRDQSGYKPVITLSSAK